MKGASLAGLFPFLFFTTVCGVIGISINFENCLSSNNFAKKGINYASEILNKYRLTSLEEPTDEMLAQIMHEVAQEAKESTEMVRKKYFDDLKASIEMSK